MTLDLFNIHHHETTPTGTAFIQDPDNRKFLEGNCAKLLQYWRRNNIYLNKRDAMNWLGVDCLAQRSADIRNSGIEMEVKIIDKLAHYRLKCTCKIVSGSDVTKGCWLHEERLRVG